MLQSSSNDFVRNNVGFRTKDIAVIGLIIARTDLMLIWCRTLSLDFDAPDTVRIAHYQNRVIIQEQPDSLDIEATNFIVSMCVCLLRL